MNRNSEYRRDMRKRHIERKKRIIKDQNDYWHYKFDGVLDKGKIHCSCPMCSMKTNNKGKNRSKYDPSKNWKHSDRVKIERGKDQLKEFKNGGVA